jgi:hypothetical protein
MKKFLTVEEFVEEYVRLSVIEGNTLTSGSRRYHNKIVDKIYKLMEKYFVDKDYEFKVLSIVINNENDRVRGDAAVTALRDGITELTDKAISVLEDVSKRQDTWGFSAEMALRIYRGEIEGKTLM